MSCSVVSIDYFAASSEGSGRRLAYGSTVELRLAGLAEVAEVLEVSKRTAMRYAARADFPLPVARLRSGPVWLEEDVLRWAAGTPVQRGRPPKHPRRN